MLSQLEMLAAKLAQPQAQVGRSSVSCRANFSEGITSTYEAAELLNILECFCSERCVQSRHRSIVSKSYSHQCEHLAHSVNDANWS